MNKDLKRLEQEINSLALSLAIKKVAYAILEALIECEENYNKESLKNENKFSSKEK